MLTLANGIPAKPKITEVVQETKVLLQQSREKLVISSVVASEAPEYIY